MVDLHDKYRGALVGVHVGDSLGAPYETKKTKEIKESIDAHSGLCFYDYPNPWLRNGGKKLVPAGKPTDDSDQTADLAASLIACRGLNLVDLRNKLIDSVIDEKSRLWNGKAKGAGRTTRRALMADPNHGQTSFMNNIGTNGSLMRAAPLALWCHKMNLSVAEVKTVVADMSSVTHAHPHCIQACQVYVQHLLRFLNGERAWKTDVTSSELEKRIWSRLLYDTDDVPYDPGAWPMRGTAEFSLYVALYAVEHSASFAEGIEKAILVGGDTDTYAAIAGGLLGAWYGYNAIPPEWRSAILGHDMMCWYAEELYRMEKVR